MANQNKQKLELGIYIFWDYNIHGAPGKKQYHCFVRGACKISKKGRFLEHFGWVMANQSKKTRGGRLYTSKLLYKSKCNIQSRSSHSEHTEVALKIRVPKK